MHTTLAVGKVDISSGSASEWMGAFSSQWPAGGADDDSTCRKLESSQTYDRMYVLLVNPCQKLLVLLPLFLPVLMLLSLPILLPMLTLQLPLAVYFRCYYSS